MNGGELFHESLQVHLQGMGERTVRQVYDLNLKRLRRDLLLKQETTSTILHSPRKFWWKWRGWLLCSVKNDVIPPLLWPPSTLEGDPGDLLHDHKKKRVNNFFLMKYFLKTCFLCFVTIYIQTSSLTQTFHAHKTLIHEGAKSKDTNVWVVNENTFPYRPSFLKGNVLIQFFSYCKSY